MPHNSILFDQLKNGAAVVVPDANYAANLKRQYERWVSSSNSLWQTPSIYAWHSWLLRLWQLHQVSQNDYRIVLSDMQQRLLWRNVIEKDTRDHNEILLWNHSASVNQAKTAWALIHEYRLDVSGYPHAANDVRVFRRWYEAYRMQLLKNDWLDPQQLADLLTHSRLEVSEQEIVYCGFSEFTPQQELLLKHIFTVSVEQIKTTVKVARGLEVYEAYDIEAELLACAMWAREKHERDPSSYIGIVVANFSHHAATVDFIFKSTFVPNFSLNDNQVDVFTSSMDNKLIDKGLIESGLNNLGLLVYRFDYETFSRFLRDMFIARDEQERHTLNQADVIFRSWVSHDLSLKDALALLNNIHNKGNLDIVGTIKQLQSLETLVGTLDKTASIGSWCDHFSRALKILNWPNVKKLNLSEKLLFKQWDQLLAKVCTVGLVCRQVSIIEALALFRDIASTTACINKQAKIRILNLDECSGARFDAAWVCGLNDTVLPTTARLNPLLPFELQRKQQLPYSSSSDCDKRAHTLMKHLYGLSDELNFSFYKNDEHTECRVSNLLADFAPKTLQPLQLDQCIQVSNQLETYCDDIGIPIEQDHTTGGAYLLKSQAQCPFKAYAEKRLDVESIDQREIGLDPAERGNLVHKVLFNLWQKIGSKAQLVSLDSEKLEALIGTEVDRAVASLDYSQKLFVDIEANRLKKLSMDWLVMEMSRKTDFKIKALEYPLIFTSCDLEFNIKVDRIDELVDGSMLVIDYKTGIASKSSWLDERVQDPQMPIYFFALGDNVAAISFAKTKEGKFDGVSATDVGVNGVSQVDNNNKGKLKDYGSWEQLTQHWKQAITGLVNEYKLGYASVTPQNISDCKYCGRQSLCRIYQHQSAESDNND